MSKHYFDIKFGTLGQLFSEIYEKFCNRYYHLIFIEFSFFSNIFF